MGDPAGSKRRIRRGDGRRAGVYTKPHDPDRPLVCLDETSKQLIAETRTSAPMKKGQPPRPIGSSQPKMPVSNSSISTLHFE
jgi:hypothetical protein